MIPLLRPDFPSLDLVNQYFSSCYDKKIFTNFGSVFDESVKQLSKLMNGEALPCTSGTTAIQAALSVMSAKGKRVAIPDYTHSGTMLAVIGAQATPVLFAVNPKTWVISIDDLKANFDQYDMVVVVSPFGYEIDFQAFETLSYELKKPIVYDMAGCFGSFPDTINPRAYSFHATKNFAVGEGGCLVLPDTKMWEHARKIINFGTNLDRSLFSDVGFNGKVDELRCAIILAMLHEENLSKVWARIKNKKATLQFYQEQLKGVVPEGEKYTSLCVVGGVPAKELEEHCLKNDIISKSYYPLLSKMPGLAHIERVTTSGPEMEKCLALPSDVSIAEAYEVVECISEYRP